MGSVLRSQDVLRIAFQARRYAAAMTVAAASPVTSRLERLAAYLEQDPGNAALLADTCDAAIECGELERAQAYVEAARRLALDSLEWSFRQARIAMARRELPRAIDLLRRLRADTGGDPVLAHDLAYAHLMQGEFETCRELVQPWLDDERATELAPEQSEALQLLWLRAMHRLRRLDEAMQWAHGRSEAGTLHAAALGAASLIALDLEDFTTARDFADAALAADRRQVEALVARGSMALAAGESAHAQELLKQALQCNPEDGRTWSALGMASLQAQDLGQAESQLEHAVGFMPGHVGSRHALGWARLLGGKHAGALAAFRAALEIDRNFAETHGALGLVLALAGDAAASRHHLAVADRLDAANLTGRYARALLAGEVSDPAALRKLAIRLLDSRGLLAGALGATVLQQITRRD